jgi:hypothetical protein
MITKFEQGKINWKPRRKAKHYDSSWVCSQCGITTWFDPKTAFGFNKSPIEYLHFIDNKECKGKMQKPK